MERRTGKRRLPLSTKRKKNRAYNLIIYRRKKRLMENVSEEERVKILKEIEALEKKMGKGRNSVTVQKECDKSEPVQTFPNEEEFILPDIAPVFETDLITDSSGNDGKMLNSLDTIKIKVEPCEEEIEPKFQINTLITSSSCRDVNCSKNCNCSCPLCVSPSLSANNVTSDFSYADFELLFEAIKYLDDHASEDKFDTAEKYYASKLRSASRSQQMLARKLINKVLLEAEMGNLSRCVGVVNNYLVKQELKLDSSDELDIQTNVMGDLSSSSYIEYEPNDANFHQPVRGYLCPARKKVFDKMQESLLKCIKQDHSTKSYAHRLRSLSSVQYFFADSLISEILSEAVFGRLRHSSEIRLPLPWKTYARKFTKKSVASSYKNFFKKSVQSIRSKSNESKGIASFTPGSVNHVLIESASTNPNECFHKNSEISSLPIQELSSIQTPTQTSERNSHTFRNTVQDSSLPITEEYIIPTQTQRSKQSSHKFLNTAQNSSLPIIKESVIARPTQTLEQNSHILLNSNSSLPTQTASFIPSPTQALKPKSPISLTLPFPNSISSGTVIPCSNPSNSSAIAKLTHSANEITIAPPSQLYLFPIAQPASSNLNQFYIVKNFGNSYLPNQETTFVPISSQIAEPNLYMPASTPLIASTKTDLTILSSDQSTSAVPLKPLMTPFSSAFSTSSQHLPPTSV